VIVSVKRLPIPGGAPGADTFPRRKITVPTTDTIAVRIIAIRVAHHGAVG